ncbi:hypothetical protein A3D70_01820 [Candidatus Adlerbacteria bacterium RIFCSPHIGHO2_02_FULL_54_18]|uniref:DUF218 domain-containing protein n=2 Tax=Candidatus Adleribacteriota TaxID=1752736 RepID=A0A1F4Y233_9BACT|nr:MAG: hypothetical protein A2949_01620 [Candidatus Adlerbacteria bacterium RIFCSPLOWO2_01_FULL_54_21b]OGC88002.1 MAG: hypothetical protein A3D70_01820 [Candidatus Adlerbacteria bacterium RIFCSPHIGHO2_02_FULL_54_18]
MKKLISILGADIWNDGGVWRTNGLDGPGDQSGVTLDRFRVVAGAYLAESQKDVTLLVQGGYAEGSRPSIASVMQKELIEFGVPVHQILLEEQSHSSYVQLLELQKIAVRERPAHLQIISNEWHLPRLKAMLEYREELSTLHTMHPEFIAAEEVLVREYPEEWQDTIAAVRKLPAVLARIKKEQQGAEQIRDGTYRFR